MSRQPRHFYEFGPFRVDEAERRLLRDGSTVLLPPKVFDTLVVLVRNSGHLMTKEDLLREVWPETFVEENNLTQNISALRKTLGTDAEGNAYIETVPRIGYRFMPAVRELGYEVAPVLIENHSQVRIVVKEEEREVVETKEAAALAPGARLIQTKRIALAAAMLIVAAVASFLLLGKFRKPNSTGALASSLQFKSMAVLPFKQIGTGDNDEYFGLGMSDVLITRLTNIRAIAVRPTSAVLKYAKQPIDPLTAGRELGVDAVLEGSVQRSTDQIRVTVRLVSVRDGASLWAEKFDTRVADIFHVQDSISGQVAQALTLKLTGEEQVRLTRRYTDNTEAYEAYLMGRYFWNKRTEEGYTRGIEQFQKAINLDANYALAYTGLADSYLLLGSYSFQPPTDAMQKARAAALKALEIDDTLAEAHTSLAVIKHRYDWDWTGAEREFKRAIEINPNYVTAHYWYAHFLVQMERFEEGRLEVQRALALDPTSPVTNHILGLNFYYSRQYDKAVDQFHKTLEMDPNLLPARLFLARAYVQKAMYAEALAELEHARGVNRDDLRMAVAFGHVYAVSGRRAEAQKILDKLQALFKGRYVAPADIALIYAGLGDKDQAFKWLERAYEERAVRRLLFLKIEPTFDSLRSDPRFTDLVRRLELRG